MTTNRCAAVMLLALLFARESLAQVNVDRYAWEFPRVTGAAGTGDEIAILREEVSAVLRAGHLAPLRVHYADEFYNGYFLYQEPGRIITTLAWAYPYVSAAQQDSIRIYVAAELADARFAPWGGSPMPLAVGARRELHQSDRVWNPDKVKSNLPTVHTIYGLWLYGERSGDWTFLPTNWSAIKNMYASRSGEGFLYGTMGAHVAMARLAGRMNDAAARTTALNNLQTAMNDGRTFATIEARAGKGAASGDWWKYMYPAKYDPRNDGLLWHGWVFLGHLSPEVGRYMQDHVAAATLARYSEGVGMFPLWWLLQAPYFCRWTGDEGVGLATEIFGMMAPLERWVIPGGAGLHDRVRSAPTGRGDCYWIEALVYAIESTGSMSWVDVRSVSATVPSRPDLLAPADLSAGITSPVTCTWSGSGPGLTYRFQLSADSLFSSRVVDSTASGMTSCVGSGLVSGTTYYWRVRALSADASSDWSPLRRFSVSGVTGIAGEGGAPATLALLQNYPNPFNPSTTISYQVPGREFVTVEIWNMLGQRVRTLVAREHGAGSYRVTWNGAGDRGMAAASGAYVCVLRSTGAIRTMRILMVR